MSADDDRAQRVFDEHLDRESGAFIEPDAREVSCGQREEQCAPDDYANDPESGQAGIPGTVDDVPLDFGIEIPVPAEQYMVLEGTTRIQPEPVSADSAGEDDSVADERELWLAQAGLVEEDELEGLSLETFSEDEIAEIIEAVGDDAADPLPDSPDGTSATGDWAAPDHGGFPDRRE